MSSNFKFKSFPGEFQKIVKEFPDSIAISFESEKISYSELDLRVTKISFKLNEVGIRQGDVIALWIEKSPDYIACILAIWKLGAVFLPLDVKTPQARVNWICEDAEVKLLVKGILCPPVTSNCFIVLPFALIANPTHSQGLSCLKLPYHTLTKDTPLEPQDDEVAYIIYTSGSTGNPKGVVVTHEGIVNFLEKQIEVFQIKPNSKILQYLSIGFDASISEIGIALLSGAEIRIEKEEELKSIEGLVEILIKERITHICLPPSLLPVLPIERIPTSLETIIIGGEVCPVETVRQWAKKFRIVNVYGPTEATVCSSLVVCGENWNKPLIGNPIPNREFHILDEKFSPVRDGESGELYLNGVGLAKEYLNQLDLTEEKFLMVNGFRMYRTGDRVLRHSSEEIEFLGRMDRQFKLRGNLIEPSEVERVLTSHSQISFAYVMKRKVSREILVAYIVLKNPSLEKEKFLLEIKQHASAFLPRWMIPERFVILEKIPINANEKLDVNAFPELELTRPKYLPSYKKPSTKQEEKLCEIFETLLSIKPIGVEDNFFALGGDSISMISLLAECSLLGISLSPEKFIQNPTVADISIINRLENSNSSNIEFLKQEANLDVEIREAIQDFPLTQKKFSNILLTGATGFLGSRILYELTQNFEAEIYCIVRNISSRDPRKYLECIFEKQEIAISDWNRIHFLEGDLSKPNLGLSEFHWDFLTSKIDTVFHFAAKVNLVLPYEKLKPANIESTKEILKFCTTKTRKYLHYASTLSVFVSSDDPRNTFYETDELNTMKEVYGGYAQTKWVAEKILLNVIQAGMDSINIYRFGLITGDSQTGYCKKDDFWAQFLKSAIELKVLPAMQNEDLKVDITPLDYAAKSCIAIAELAAPAASMKSNSRPNTFHIANPNSLRLVDLISILKELGIQISQVSKEEFLENCKSNSLEDYLYLSLSRLLLETTAFTFIRPLDLFQATEIRFDFANTDKILFGLGISCPYPNAKLIKKYLQRLSQIN